MSQAVLPSLPFTQQIEYVLNALHQSRILAGLMVSLVLIVLMTGRPDAFAELASSALRTGIRVDAAQAEAKAEPKNPLDQKMQMALEFVARKYHVSSEALAPTFIAAQASARETGIDPLMIVAVISIESRFNPYAESAVGAQGLMQVMPQFHRDKIPEGTDNTVLFDPETNVQIGAQILKDSIHREGGLIAGLQQFAGASDDPELSYANKVIAEKQSIEAAITRPRRF